MTTTTSRPESRKKGPEVLAYFGVVLSEQLGKEGLPEREASNIALNVMDVMKFEFGGQNVYFPQGVVVNRDAKVDEVYRRFMDGESIQDLAHAFGHSIQTIYKLIAEARAKRRAKRDDEDS